MSQFSLLLRGSALRTAEGIIAIIAGFITLPLMNNSLGSELYGLWVLIGSVTAMMYLFDMGFASAVTQKIAYSIGQKDHKKTNGVITTALFIYTSLALIICAVVAVAAIFYKPDLHHLITDTEFRWILIVSGFAIAFEFPAKAFAGLAQAHFRHDLVAIYRICFRVISTLVIILFLHLGYKILAIAIINLCFSVMSTLCFVMVGRYVYKEMQISSGLISRSIFDELFSYSAWAFLIDLNRGLKNRVDLFFIGAYISLGAVATYYVAVRLVDYLTELLYKMLSITMPTLAQHSASGDKESFRNDLLLFNRINMYAYSLGVILFLVLGKSILYYWLGSEFDYEGAFIVLIIISLGRVSVIAIDGYVTSLYSENKHKIMVFSGFAETVATIILLYLFLAHYEKDVFYAAIAISLPILIFRFFLMPWLCYRALSLPRYVQLVWLSYRPGLICLLCFGVHYVFNNANPTINANLIYETVTVFLMIVFFAFNEMQTREKQLLSRLFFQIKNKVFVKN